MILIATSVGHNMMPWKTTQCLINGILYLKEKGLEVKFYMPEGPYVEDNRNKALALATRDEIDYLIVIDWDHTFPPETIYNLYKTAIDNNLDLCSGIYNVRVGEYVRPAIIINNIVPENYPKESLFEVDTYANSFSIISKKAVQSLAQTRGYGRIDGKGEDVSFCQRAKELGFKVWCDSRIKVGHLRFTEV